MVSPKTPTPQSQKRKVFQKRVSAAFYKVSLGFIAEGLLRASSG